MNLFEHFEDIDDPRVARTKKHILKADLHNKTT